MEILKKVTEFVSKYRYVVLVLLLGVILMLLPTGSKETQDTLQTEPGIEQSVDIQAQLEDILAQIQGVGKVQVMLTLEAGEQTVYQYDESGTNRDTVIITDADRAQSGLVEQVYSPCYRGAVIVCQGADSAVVRLNVIEAVSKVTGLSTDKISVLKMK